MLCQSGFDESWTPSKTALRQEGIEMVVALVILVAFGIYQTDSVQEFRANSNHNPVYKIVRGVPCDSGLKSSGYSVVPTGKLYLKQANRDGTVGNICRP